MKISKVNSRPVNPTPNTLYFEKSVLSGLFKIYFTDVNGEYIEEDQALASEAAITALQALVNQPNGVAGLDASRILGSEVRIDGQNTKIITDVGGFVWRDYIQNFTVKAVSGTNNPTFGTLVGNFQGYLFSASNMAQVWADFHIDHDYAMGTYIFPHVHWSPTSNNAGVVRWGFEYMVAKGHQQQIFGNPVTAYVNHAVAANSNDMHMVSEVSAADAIPPLNLEPDSYVKIRIFRDAANAADTYGSTVHAWGADLHYQSARLGTKNKAPNFFG